MRLLLDAGANAQTARWDDVTPLFTAVDGGHAACVRELLKERYRWNKESMKLIHTASERGHTEILELLLNVIGRKVQIDVPRFDGATALYLATRNAHYDCVKVLLDAGASMVPTKRRVKTLSDHDDGPDVFDVFDAARDNKHVLHQHFHRGGPDAVEHASILELLEFTREERAKKKSSSVCVVQ